MELFLLYLWLKLDTFTRAAEGLAWLCALIIIISGFIYLVACSEREDNIKRTSQRCLKSAAVVGILGWICYVILPTTKETAVLVGGYYALSAVKSTEGQKVVSLLRAAANNMLDEQLKKVTK